MRVSFSLGIRCLTIKLTGARPPALDRRNHVRGRPVERHVRWRVVTSMAKVLEGQRDGATLRLQREARRGRARYRWREH